MGEAEETLSWRMETGLRYYEIPERKYLSRYDIKLQLEKGGWMRVWLNYDSGEDWVQAAQIEGRGMNTVLLPLRPRRCDHMRMRLEGEGELRLFSVTRILRKGSDRP